MIANAITSNVGADITAEGSFGESTSIDEYHISQFLEQYKKKFPDHIDDYTFMTTHIDEMPGMKFLPKTIRGITEQPFL